MRETSRPCETWSFLDANYLWRELSRDDLSSTDDDPAFARGDMVDLGCDLALFAPFGCDAGGGQGTVSTQELDSACVDQSLCTALARRANSYGCECARRGYLVRPRVRFCRACSDPRGQTFQLGFAGGGELLVGQVRPRPSLPSDGPWTAILLKVDDAAATLARAIDNYATADFGLQDGEAGERQAMIEDVFGHRWIVVQPGQILTNGSAPRAHVVPVLWSADVRAAVDWYTRVFGFVGDVQTPESGRAELGLPGGGELIVGEARPLPRLSSDGRSPEILLKVEDAEATLARAVENGATVVFELRDIEAGERQATIDDVFGHRWLLTQTLVDTAPEMWGGKTVTPRQ